LHMNPHMMDTSGLVSGHELAEGEIIGTVGNYGRFEGGTSYHLHFDVQVPTRRGWVFVNPYTTLVAAYERLIGAKGQIATPEASNPPPVDGMSESAEAERTGKSGSKGEPEQQRGHRAVIEHCKTRVVRGYRRRVCWTDAADNGERANPSRGVRTVDRGVSR